MVAFLAGASGRNVARPVTEYKQGQDPVLTPLHGGVGKAALAPKRRPEHVMKDLATSKKVSTKNTDSENYKITTVR